MQSWQLGNGENLVNAGISMNVGQGNHVSTTKVAMAKEIVDLRNQVKQLTDMVKGMVANNYDSSKTAVFPDVPANHWAYDYVARLAGNGIIKGYPNGTFDGGRTMTRYEFAALLDRVLQKGAEIDGKLLNEFKPELERIRVDRLYPNTMKIDCVRVITGRG